MRRAVLVLLALVAALAPVPAAVVERLYSNGFYAAVQPAVTSASNRVPFSCLDALIVLGIGVLIALVARTAQRWRHGRAAAAIGALLLDAAAIAAVVYLAFVVMWGWNYRRRPLADRLDYSASRVSRDRATSLARSAVDALNSLHRPAHAAGWTTIGLVDPALAHAFDDTVRTLGSTRGPVVGRPKTTMLEPYFRRAGVSGMTDPFLLETLVDDTLLPFERPFVIAHEWAHLAGYADEGEANFAGLLTCMRGGPGDQYSGWLFLYDELARLVTPRDRAELRQALDPGVVEDFRATADRLNRNINPRVALAGWRVYDRYLKANRVAEGTASYDTVVRLVLGVRFEDGWRPAASPHE